MPAAFGAQHQHDPSFASTDMTHDMAQEGAISQDVSETSTGSLEIRYMTCRAGKEQQQDGFARQISDVSTIGEPHQFGRQVSPGNALSREVDPFIPRRPHCVGAQPSTTISPLRSAAAGQGAPFYGEASHVLAWVRHELQQDAVATQERREALLRDLAARLRTLHCHGPCGHAGGLPSERPLLSGRKESLPVDSNESSQDNECHESKPVSSSPRIPSVETIACSLPGEVQDIHLKPEFSDVAGRRSSLSSEHHPRMNRLTTLIGDEPVDTSTPIVQRMVKNPLFEAVFAGLIVANTLVLVLEAQHAGLTLGYDIKYYESKVSWHKFKETMVILEWFFGGVFALELALKVIGLRKAFIYDFWNWIDTFIVICWVLDVVGGAILPLPSNMVRLVRLVRLLRLLKLVRTLKGFDALYLITTSIKGSFLILSWSLLLLLLTQTLFALIMQNLIHLYIDEQMMVPSSQNIDDSISTTLAQREELYKFFGTFSRCMLTMFEMMFGNWYTPCRVLVETVGEWYVVFALLHLVVFGFGVIAVINGVFINETFKVAESDDKFMMMQQAHDQRMHVQKMRDLFMAADADGSGEISVDEFKDIVDNPNVKSWLAAMQLEADSVDILFNLIDVNGDGNLTVEEVVQGAGRLKGAAKSFDLAALTMIVRELQQSIAEVHKQVHNIETLSSTRPPSASSSHGPTPSPPWPAKQVCLT